MTVYYLAREVKPGTPCSYPPGRTFLNDDPSFSNETDAQRLAERYTDCAAVPGIRYFVVSCDDAIEWDNTLTATGCDRFARP